MALVVAVAMVLCLMPVMMVSAASFTSTGDGITKVTAPVTADPTITFTVEYQMTATTSDQVTLLVTKDTEAITYTNGQPDNIKYIDQVPYTVPAVGTSAYFTFVIDKPEVGTTTYYYVKVGGSEITQPASKTAEVKVDSLGFTVTGYVAVAGSTATIGGTQLSATADADGLFTINNVPAGTYDLTLAKKGALTRTILIGTLSSNLEVSVSTNKIPLFIGDGSGDGIINNDDLLGVKGVFGKADGITGYDPLYDVNNDNIINNDDLLSVKGSFGKSTSSYLPWVK